MSGFAPPLERAINELTKLPGVGPKTAQRLVFHLLRAPTDDASALAEAIVDLRRSIRFCRVCFHLASDELCPVCADPTRESAELCVVEEPANVFALERTGAYRGLYHVLGGALSPLEDVGPEQLRVAELLDRVRDCGFREVILATNPNVEGEATAVYLSRLLEPLSPRVTRLAQGLPAGGDLDFTDDLTIRRAIEGRRSF